MLLFCVVNVQVKMKLSIENFIFLKIDGVNEILFGDGSHHQPLYYNRATNTTNIIFNFPSK